MENLDTMFPVIDQHYKDNYKRLIKTVTYRADTQWGAEDCIQEAYLRCMKYWPAYNQEIEFGRWFSMILNNCIREYKNAEKGHFAEEYLEDVHEGMDCDKHVHRIWWGINKIIAKKPEPMKEILTYHFEYGYSAMDISRVTPHSYANTHKVIQRFKEELREIYGS